MPNWVFNDVTIEGDTESIAKVKAQLSQPITVHKRDWQTMVTTTEIVTPVLSFLNIVAPPADKMDEYHGIHGFADGKEQGKTSYNWYNFNNANWGTKWDVEAELTLDLPEKIAYRFDTAWSPPQNALIALSEQYPTLTITNEWEEEQGFGSTLIYTDGEEDEIDGYNWRCDSGHKHSEDPAEFYDEELDEYICPQCPTEVLENV
jgi:hypothetical protein